MEENICSVQSAKKISVGYKILQSPYKYSPKKQKKFDVESAKKLTKKYSAESVKNLIQNLSPLGRKNKNYLEKFCRKCERMVGVVLESCRKNVGEIVGRNSKINYKKIFKKSLQKKSTIFLFFSIKNLEKNFFKIGQKSKITLKNKKWLNYAIYKFL